MTCNGTTSVTFNIPNDKWGSYLFVVNDKQGGHTFAKVINFDWGYGHSSSASGAPAQLSMKSTAESYQVGEKIVVTFPANDKAKALVTVEANDRVMQTLWVDNLGSEGKVEITATEEMIPNVYVYVSLIQPHDANNDMPIRLYGVIPVKVENKKLQLQPKIQIPESANTKKKVDVRITEASGQAMTYTVAVVDEGILGLTNFATPNPYGYFNSKQALSVRTWDNYDAIVDAFSGELGSVYAIGGDGILNQEITLDKRFKEVAPDQVLEFGFGVRRQNFSLVTMQPICTSNEEMDYNIRLAFATPIDQSDAVKLFDESFCKEHPVQVSYIGNNVFDFLVQGLKRENADYQVPVILDGKPIDCKAKMQRELTVYAKDGFKPVMFDVDKAGSRASLFFTQPLKEDQNLDGFVTFNKALGYKADIKGNQIDFYFDKTSLNNYELSELVMTAGSGIRAANGMVLQSEFPFDFDLTDNLPKVRWTDDGVIIPNVDETTVYFDAICLNAVTLRIIRVFDDNILSFLQDNELNETYGIRKAGRLEKKVRLAIDNPYANQWKTFPIVLSDYIKVEPGAMYQLSLNFGPADYTFATDEMRNAVMDDEAREAAYWDGQRYDYKKYNYDGEWNDPNGYYYYNYVEEKKNIVVSDLAVTAKMGRNDIVDVYVYRISDATPASGAQVMAYNFQKQELAKGNADGKGHVQLQCANRPAFVVATDKKGSKSVIKLNDGNALSYSRFNVAGEPVEKGVSNGNY